MADTQLERSLRAWERFLRRGMLKLGMCATRSSGLGNAAMKRALTLSRLSFRSSRTGTNCRRR